MLQKLARRNQKGFTLVELMIVVAIIGILASIAIPQFISYRKRSYCAKVESAVHNYITGQEAYYTENDAYAAGESSLTGYVPTDGVTVTGDPSTSVIGTDTTGNCTLGNTLTYDSTGYSWSQSS